MKKLLIIAIVIIVVVSICGIGLLKWREKPSFCGICHENKPYLSSYESPPLLANLHAKADIRCLDCHEIKIPQHLTKKFEDDPMKERSFPKEFCFKCHGDNGITGIIQLTADLERNPHSDPHKGADEEVKCNECHKMHRKSKAYCLKCHDDFKLGPQWEL
jgi:hypothetical protein